MSTAPKTRVAAPRKARTPSGKATAADSLNEICSVRIELRDTDPLIWRAVEVPTSVTLLVLHEIIQVTMGWFNSHLWEFRIGERTYGLPMDDAWGMEPRGDAETVRLRDVLTPRKTRIRYLYDFGDSWEHLVTVTAVRPGEPGVAYPRYVGGEWAGPPEDCGGIPGFYNMLEVMADPKHPDHEQIKEWLEEYDPKVIDVVRITNALNRMAGRRDAARTRIAKKTA